MSLSAKSPQFLVLHCRRHYWNGKNKNIEIEKIKTRRPLSTGIFSATESMQESMAKERIEPTTYWLGNTKNFQAPARVRAYDLLAGKAISEVHFTRWSGDKVEFWQNLFKKTRHRS